MPSFSNDQHTTLQAQHTLQGDDLTTICNLASMEGADIDSLWQSIVSWDFDQLLGFTLHLFITAKSADVRTQITQVLPKFGSKIVHPLVTISHHFYNNSRHESSDISRLAQQSTQRINPQALSLGFAEALTGKNAAVLSPIVVNCLTALPVQHYKTVLSSLAQQLTSQGYRALERQILNACSHAQLQENFDDMPSLHNILDNRSMAPVKREAHLVG